MHVRWLVRASALLAVEIAVAVLIVSMIREEPAPAGAPAAAIAGTDAVAADPASYRTAGELRVRGRILEYPVRVS